MKQKNGMSRRKFLISFALAGAGAELASLYRRSGASYIAGANDRIRMGVIGLGSKGSQHVSELLQLPGVEVAALCDIDEQQLRRSAALVLKSGQPGPVTFTDFRRIIDSQEIDAVSIATPARFHGPMAIEACESGKDVYVEKPCSVKFSEGKRLVSIAEQNGRIVQQRMGSTFAVTHESAPLLASPTLGEVSRVSGTRLIYDPPRNTQRLTNLVDEAFDELDLARAMLEVGLPTQVSTVGMEDIRGRGLAKVGIRMLFNSPHEAERELNFQVETTRFPNRLASMHSNPSSSHFESFNKFATAHGDFAIMCNFLNHQPENDLANFVSCVRDREQQASNFPVAEAQMSSALVQLAQLSLRHQRAFAFDPQSEQVIDDAEINARLTE